MKKDPLLDKYTQTILENVSFAQDAGEILGRGFRGMAQRAKDVQDAKGEITAKIMGTPYPRVANYPTLHPRDFERAARAHQKNLLFKNIDLEKISNDIVYSILNKAKNVFGDFDREELNKPIADFLTDLVDKEFKILKKTGMDTDNALRLRREIYQKLGLDLYRYQG